MGRKRRIEIKCGVHGCDKMGQVGGRCRRHYSILYSRAGKPPPPTNEYVLAMGLVAKEKHEDRPRVVREVLSRRDKPGKDAHERAFRFLRDAETDIAVIYRRGPWDHTHRGVFLVSVGKTSPDKALDKAIEKLVALRDSGNIVPSDIVVPMGGSSNG